MEYEKDMSMKLKDKYEIGMWYDGKKKNMSEDEVILAIKLLRAICEL